MEHIDSLQRTQPIDENPRLKLPFIVKVTINKLAVTLLEVSRTDSECVFRLFINNLPRHTISVLPYYRPALALTDSYIMVWAGKCVSVVATSTDKAIDYIHDDEIHWIFQTERTWCFVSELSVTLHDLENLSIIASYFHTEIILECKWDDTVLTIKDLQNRSIQLHVTNGNLLLSCIHYASGLRTLVWCRLVSAIRWEVQSRPMMLNGIFNQGFNCSPIFSGASVVFHSGTA